MDQVGHESAAIDLLQKNGFKVVPVEHTAEIRKEGITNPADLRTQVAFHLSMAGFRCYWLKEVYAFQGSKKPWRTDEEGFVEVEFWEEFTQVTGPQDLNLKVKRKLQSRNEVNP